ncbi:MAG: YeeE/YedE family protein [Rhodobacteraceae bacterium]|nr:YeeE/YedE family protein [Paracoccaceae bacterium]
MIAALVGILTGSVLGLAARFGGFGTLSALRAAIELGDQRRVRLWGIVCGTAVIATFMLDGMGLVSIAATPWHSQAWVPVASVAGGIFFGYGMALAGSCGFEALVRVGAGDLRALVIVAIIGVSASALQTGPLSGLRALLVPEKAAVMPQGAAHWLAGEIPLSPFFFACLIGALMIAPALAYAPLRQSPGRILWGMAVGLAVAFCLAATTWLNGRTGGAVPVDGPGFGLPLGKAILYLMAPADIGAMLAAGLVAGVLAGAIAGAVFRGFFRAHHAEANPSLGRMAAGAVMMGIGAGLALGDPVGQGVSGMATLAWSAPVMILSCLAGCFLGRRWLLDYDYRDPNAQEFDGAWETDAA